MMGRPPLPTHIKLVQGNCPAASFESKRAEAAACRAGTAAAPHRTGESQVHSMAEMLVRRGVMTELDAGALARYATAWCRWVDAEAEIKKRGLVVKTNADFVIQNPFLAVANRCMNQMAQIESEFGLTPSARTRIRMEELTGEIDPFEEYLRGGKQLDLWRPEKT
jgi:P27 family predicted phage terminase small subunit